MKEPRRSCVSAGGTGSPKSGAEGIRTPDLLIAKVPRADARRAPSASPMPPFHRSSEWGHTWGTRHPSRTMPDRAPDLGVCVARHPRRSAPKRWFRRLRAAFSATSRVGTWCPVMTLHKLHAGDGYTYLTRQVAAGDERRSPGQQLTDYYLASGNPPGRWMGAGAADLGIAGTVREDQMRSLFGRGLHPDAEQIVALEQAAGTPTGTAAPGREAGPGVPAVPAPPTACGAGRGAAGGVRGRARACAVADGAVEDRGAGGPPGAPRRSPGTTWSSPRSSPRPCSGRSGRPRPGRPWRTPTTRPSPTRWRGWRPRPRWPGSATGASSRSRPAASWPPGSTTATPAPATPTCTPTWRSRTRSAPATTTPTADPGGCPWTPAPCTPPRSPPPSGTTPASRTPSPVASA